MAFPTQAQRQALIDAGYGWPVKDWKAKYDDLVASGAAAPVATLTAPKPQAESGGTDLLTMLAKAAEAATRESKTDETIFKQATALLNSLSPEARLKLFRTQEGQALAEMLVDKAPEADHGLPPGSKVAQGGLENVREWTRGDQERLYPKVKFIPFETIKVIVNTVEWQLIAHQENEVPSIVYDVYRQRYQAAQESEAWKHRFFSPNNPWGHPGTYTPGSGWAAEALGQPVDAAVVAGIQAAQGTGA